MSHGAFSIQDQPAFRQIDADIELRVEVSLKLVMTNLKRDSGDHTLASASVRFGSRANDLAAPDVLDHVVLADDSVPIAHQVDKKAAHAEFQHDRRAVSMQFPARPNDDVVAKMYVHPPPHRLRAGQRRASTNIIQVSHK
jgi:hypothetical protein